MPRVDVDDRNHPAMGRARERLVRRRGRMRLRDGDVRLRLCDPQLGDELTPIRRTLGATTEGRTSRPCRRRCAIHELHRHGRIQKRGIECAWVPSRYPKEGPQPGGRGPSERREGEFALKCHVTPGGGFLAQSTLPLFYILVVARFAVDVTACWRPQRVGMITVAIELTRALVANRSGDEFVLLCSRERPDSLRDLDCEAVYAPYRHELAIKARWLPAGVEPGFILAVGSVEPRKNYPRLLAAYRQLRGRGALPFIINGRPGVPQLVIAGRKGWAYGDTLERIAAEPGVRYLGHVDEPTLAALYGSASVLAFPSLYEGFGLPLLEAMARGVPAVVGATGALPEMARGAAISVNAEDTASIAGGLERLLADEGLRKKLGEEGIRRARGYSWANAAERTLDVLRRIGQTSANKAA